MKKKRNNERLDHCFSTRVILSPRGHLLTSGNIFFLLTTTVHVCVPTTGI